MITSRRFALATAAIVFGLSGCGSANDTSTAGSTPGTGLTAATTGAVASAPHVIRLGGGAAAPAAGTMSSESADSKMMAFGNVTYVFDGTLPTLADSAPSWQFPIGFAPDAARVAAMAATLGVGGDVREVPADQGGGWMVGPADYSSATFTVSSDSLGSWWFSPTPTMSATTSACVYSEGDVVGSTDVAVPAGDTLSTVSPLDDAAGSSASPSIAAPSTGDTAVVSPPPCAQPVPPTGVPDQATALASTKSLLTSLGYDSSAYDFEFYGDEWSASVTASLLLGGQRSPITINVGYGAEGALSWASGSLATPVQGDDYPLAGPQTGIDRLSDQARQWMSYGGYAGSGMRTEAAGTASVTDGAIAGSVETAVPPDTGSASTVVADPAADPASSGAATPGASMPVPCDPAADCVAIDPAPVTVHLVDVRVDSTMIWDADGTTWLLPAYTFTDADGGSYTIIAVADEFLDIPAPVAVPLPEPLPAETIADTTVDIVVGDPTGSAGAGDMTPIDQSAAEAALVGLSEDAAGAAATASGWSLRVSERDGIAQVLTADYSPMRVNVAVTGGVVTAVQSIG